MHISEQRQDGNERKQRVPTEGVKMKYFLDKKYAVVDHTIINYTGDNVTLKVPDEKHRKKNVENKYVLMVFTDRFALNTYDTSSSIITTETDLDELYRLAEEDETIMGIVVNPGREDFRMKKY